jgi:hypothetical protein
MTRFGLLLVIVGLLSGCRDLLKEKPVDTELAGRWVATKVDENVARFLAKTGAKMRPETLPSFELNKDGTVAVVNLPTATGLDEGVLFDTTGSWRVTSLGQADEKMWQLLLLLPKRGVTYTFHKDKRGVYLAEAFDVDSGAGIEFRRQ